MINEVDKSTFNNSWFKEDIPKIKLYSWYFFRIILFDNPFIISYRLKAFILRLHGAKIGDSFIIKPGVNIKFPWKLECGDFVSIGENAWIDNLDHVIIENQVTISQGAYILTGNHNFKKKSFDLITKPVIIKKGAWIGARAIICPGVIMANHSIVTVGSTLTVNTKEFTIYQGNPANAINKRIISD
jgi:putative colanic acid biosynthesis acetyltransferase WcaF